MESILKNYKHMHVLYNREPCYCFKRLTILHGAKISNLSAIKLHVIPFIHQPNPPGGVFSGVVKQPDSLKGIKMCEKCSQLSVFIIISIGGGVKKSQ